MYKIFTIFLVTFLINGCSILDNLIGTVKETTNEAITATTKIKDKSVDSKNELMETTNQIKDSVSNIKSDLEYKKAHLEKTISDTQNAIDKVNQAVEAIDEIGVPPEKEDKTNTQDL